MTATVQDVEYRPLPGFPGYRVGADGSIWSCRVKCGGQRKGELLLGDIWKQLKTRLRPGHNEYEIVDLRAAPGGKLRRHYIHRLVLSAFAGPCPVGMECCHNNGNHLDNRAENLRWDTKKANAADGVRHGTVAKGEQVVGSKLSPEKIREIRRLAATGLFLQREIGRMFDIAQTTVSGIARMEDWRHVQ